MINEDGTTESRAVMAAKGRDGSIWRFDLVKGPTGAVGVDATTATRVAQLDPPGRDGVPVGPGVWETSGIIDASAMFGADIWLSDVQAHPPTTPAGGRDRDRGGRPAVPAATHLGHVRSRANLVELVPGCDIGGDRAERMIYHHFGSKDGLYAAVLEAQTHGLVDAWRQVIDTAIAMEPYEGMRMVLAGFADLYAARPLLLALTLHEALGGWRTLPPPTADSPPFPQLRKLYERGQRQGCSAPTAPLRSPTGSPWRAGRQRGACPRGVEVLTVAGPLFTLAWAVEGATRAHYHPLRHPVSSLELGHLGWTQQANFFVAGGLTLAFAVGLRRALRPLGGSTWGPLLVGAHAIGLLGAGVFVTDPVSGYPPGTPDHLPAYGSVHAALHDLSSVGTFVGLPLACLVFARRFAGWGQPGWATYSAATGLAFVTGFVLSSMAFNQVEPLVAVGGLLQRFTVILGWTWQTLLAVHLLRTLPEPPTSRPT